MCASVFNNPIPSDQALGHHPREPFYTRRDAVRERFYPRPAKVFTSTGYPHPRKAQAQRLNCRAIELGA
jgi:hypothetical protein